MIYEPSDDSYFFEEFLKDYFSKFSKNQKQNITYLDMGTGSGILSQTALNSGIKKENILASDINPEVIEHIKEKLPKIKVIQSDLFQKIEGRFNIITFNAPYLPKDKNEPKDSQLATTGGEKGDEISLKFLQQAKAHLKEHGRIFLLISSLTPLNKIKKFKPKIIAKKKIFFEELLILELTF
jgi:release factor glutamine methyltransferase